MQTSATTTPRRRLIEAEWVIEANPKIFYFLFFPTLTVDQAKFHWRRFAALYAKLVHAETVFSMISALLGYRLRCRSKKGRKNEVRVKLALFNLIQLAMRKEFWS